jgi:hypothetical protein
MAVVAPIVGNKSVTLPLVNPLTQFANDAVSAVSFEDVIANAYAAGYAKAMEAKPTKAPRKGAKAKPKLVKMTVKREAEIREQLTKLWHDRVDLRKKSGRDAEYASGMIAQMNALKAELKAAGKDSRPCW